MAGARRVGNQKCVSIVQVRDVRLMSIFDLRIIRAPTKLNLLSEFHSDAKLALDDISLSVQAGEKVALIGRTGR